MVEGSLVDGLEAGLLAVVEANAELDLRNSAFTEVTDGRRRASCSSRGCGRRGGRVDSSSCNCDLCRKSVKSRDKNGIQRDVQQSWMQQKQLSRSRSPFQQ